MLDDEETLKIRAEQEAAKVEMPPEIARRLLENRDAVMISEYLRDCIASGFSFEDVLKGSVPLPYSTTNYPPTHNFNSINEEKDINNLTIQSLKSSRHQVKLNKHHNSPGDGQYHPDASGQNYHQTLNNNVHNGETETKPSDDDSMSSFTAWSNARLLTQSSLSSLHKFSKHGSQSVGNSTRSPQHRVISNSKCMSRPQSAVSCSMLSKEMGKIVNTNNLSSSPSKITSTSDLKIRVIELEKELYTTLERLHHNSSPLKSNSSPHSSPHYKNTATDATTVDKKFTTFSSILPRPNSPLVDSHSFSKDPSVYFSSSTSFNKKIPISPISGPVTKFANFKDVKLKPSFSPPSSSSVSPPTQQPSNQPQDAQIVYANPPLEFNPNVAFNSDSLEISPSTHKCTSSALLANKVEDCAEELTVPDEQLHKVNVIANKQNLESEFLSEDEFSVNGDRNKPSSSRGGGGSLVSSRKNFFESSASAGLPQSPNVNQTEIDTARNNIQPQIISVADFSRSESPIQEEKHPVNKIHNFKSSSICDSAVVGLDNPHDNILSRFTARRVEELETEVSRLFKLNSDLSSKMTNCSCNNDKANILNVLLKKELADSRSLLLKEKETARVAENSRLDSQVLVESLKKQLDVYEDKLSVAVGHLEAVLLENSGLSEELKQTGDDLTKTVSLLTLKEEKMSKVFKESASLMNEKASLLKEIADLKKSKKSKHIDLETQITTLTNVSTDMSAKIQNLEQLSDSANQEKDNLSLLLDKERIKNCELLEDLKYKDKKLKDLSDEMNLLHFEEIAQLKQNFEKEMTNEISKKTQEFECLESQQKSQIDIYTNRINELEQELLQTKSAVDEVVNIKKELSLKSDECLTLETDLYNVKSEISNLQMQLESQQKYFEDEKMKLLTNKEEKETFLQNQINTEVKTQHLKEIQAFEDEVEELKSQINHRQLLIVEMTGHLDRVSNELQNNAQETDELQLELNKLTESHNELKDKYMIASQTIVDKEDEIKVLFDATHEEKNSLELHLKNLNREKRSLEIQLESLEVNNKDRIDLQIKIESANNKIDSLTKENQNLEEILSNTVMQLKQEIENTKEELTIKDKTSKDLLEQKNSTIEQMDLENNIMKNDILVVRGELSIKNEELALKEEELITLRETLDAKTSLVSFLENQILSSGESTQRIVELESQVSDLRASLQLATSEAESFSVDVFQLEEEISDLKDSISDYQSKYNAICSSSKLRESELLANIEALSSDISNLMNRPPNDESVDFQTLSAELEKYKFDYDELIQVYNVATATISTLKEALETTKTRAEELEAERIEVDETLEAAEIILKEKEIECDELQTRVTELKSQLTATAIHSSSVAVDYSIDTKDSNSELNLIRKQLLNETNTLSTCQAERDSLSTELSRMEESMRKLKERLNAAQDETESLKNQMAHLDESKEKNALSHQAEIDSLLERQMLLVEQLAENQNILEIHQVRLKNEKALREELEKTLAVERSKNAEEATSNPQSDELNNELQCIDDEPLLKSPSRTPANVNMDPFLEELRNKLKKREETETIDEIKDTNLDDINDFNSKNTFSSTTENVNFEENGGGAGKKKNNNPTARSLMKKWWGAPKK